MASAPTIRSGATRAWLALDARTRAALAASDHLLDALVAALVARAQLLGRTVPIPDDALPAARAEGWIHLPQRQPLAAFDSFASSAA